MTLQEVEDLRQAHTRARQTAEVASKRCTDAAKRHEAAIVEMAQAKEAVRMASEAERSAWAEEARTFDAHLAAVLEHRKAEEERRRPPAPTRTVERA